MASIIQSERKCVHWATVVHTWADFHTPIGRHFQISPEFRYCASTGWALWVGENRLKTDWKLVRNLAGNRFKTDWKLVRNLAGNRFKTVWKLVRNLAGNRFLKLIENWWEIWLEGTWVRVFLPPDIRPWVWGIWRWGGVASPDWAVPDNAPTRSRTVPSPPSCCYCTRSHWLKFGGDSVYNQSRWADSFQDY